MDHIHGIYLAQRGEPMSSSEDKIALGAIAIAVLGLCMINLVNLATLRAKNVEINELQAEVVHVNEIKAEIARALQEKSAEVNEIKAEAVRRGHAEFHLADVPAWRWKETPEAKP
jgi:hypothetical protein